MTNEEFKDVWGKAKDNTVEQLISLFCSLSKKTEEFPWAKEAHDYLKLITKK
jgi:hypothetical protein